MADERLFITEESCIDMFFVNKSTFTPEFHVNKYADLIIISDEDLLMLTVMPAKVFKLST